MRPIDADILKEQFPRGTYWEYQDNKNSNKYICEVIDAQDTVDAEPVRHGEWVEDGAIIKCDKCGEHKQFPHWKFCPNCGAKMEASHE